jgi:hypothetical protein
MLVQIESRSHIKRIVRGLSRSGFCPFSDPVSVVSEALKWRFSFGESRAIRASRTYGWFFWCFPVTDLWWLGIPESLSRMSRLTDSGFRVPRVVCCTRTANSTPQSTNHRTRELTPAIGGKGYHCEGIVRRRRMQQSANVCLPSQGASTWKSRTVCLVTREILAHLQYFPITNDD